MLARTDSYVYTLNGKSTFRQILESQGKSEDSSKLMVLCCNISSELYFNFTEIQIIKHVIKDATEVGNKKKNLMVFLDEDKKTILNKLSANYKLNDVSSNRVATSQGWSETVEPLTETEETLLGKERGLKNIKVFDEKSESIVTRSSNPKIKNSVETRDLYEVNGLPIGIIIDDIIFYPYKAYNFIIKRNEDNIKDNTIPSRVTFKFKGFSDDPYIKELRAVENELIGKKDVSAKELKSLPSYKNLRSAEYPRVKIFSDEEVDTENEITIDDYDDYDDMDSEYSENPEDQGGIADIIGDESEGTDESQKTDESETSEDDIASGSNPDYPSFGNSIFKSGDDLRGRPRKVIVRNQKPSDQDDDDNISDDLDDHSINTILDINPDELIMDEISDVGQRTPGNTPNLDELRRDIVKDPYSYVDGSSSVDDSNALETSHTTVSGVDDFSTDVNTENSSELDSDLEEINY